MSDPIALPGFTASSTQMVKLFYTALGEVEAVTKSQTAGEKGGKVIKYANLGSVVDEVQRVLRALMMEVTQIPHVTAEGLFAVTNMLIHESGEWLAFVPMAMKLPPDAQAVGSAQTYLRRYSLVGQFGMEVVDDDGAAATNAVTKAGARTPAEKEIRAAIEAMPTEVRTRFVADWKREFSQALLDMPTTRHGDGLTFLKAWQAAEEMGMHETADQVRENIEGQQ
jgi:hypothetical protein